LRSRPAIEALITLVQSVVATPRVLDYLPLQPDMTVLKADIVHNERLHFYTVRRVSADIGQRGGNFTSFTHPLHIEGRLAYIDSSTQALFDDELDAILSAIAAHPGLSGAVEGYQGLRLAENKPYAFYNQAVHYGRIELEARIL